jgi:DNA processing protein
MNHEELILVVLVSKYKLTPLRLTQIQAAYPTLIDAIKDSFALLKKSAWSETLQHTKDWDEECSECRDLLSKHGISVMSKFSDQYPVSLKELPDGPIVLFYQGDITLLNDANLLTVVGSRNYTRYSEMVLDGILVPVVQAGAIVVSGLAVGIDMLAHQIAVDNRQKTIGVIGSGLDDAHFYPSSNLALKNNIVEQGGLVLSEYPIGFEATKFSFPRRNRILAALSPVTWVVEASSKSGSLITATEAQKLGRTVITTQAPLFEEQFSGNTKLFQGGVGLVTCAQDIIDVLGITTNIVKKAVSKAPTDEVQKKIFDCLDIAGKSIDQIADQSDTPTQSLLGILTVMEMEGYTENIGQNVWVKK